jgi:hypothetical protein
MLNEVLPPVFSLQLILAIASVCGVFFLVPRGVTVGSIQV